MKTETKLARVFTTLAGDEKRIENTAAQILAIAVEASVKTVEDFDPLVRAAYEANGWNIRAGRPTSGSVAEEVPDTVRTYVSWVRSALREELKLSRFKTFYDLRKALRDKRGIRSVKSTAEAEPEAVLPADVAQDFDGVRITNPLQPNGALFHDLGAVFAKLQGDQRQLLGRQLAKLLHQYLPVAFPAPSTQRTRRAAAMAA